eukprot:CAMPEP_0196774752 /NCGR_PEP_ID=MMETSP1104-20130614/3607_1 /TAXON_ID=33652 /ORGANISM="Cafeteria sp., Strain Caron Lab Isolate" /LENGTH=138 /DNA_ID=CAMNT_0042144915 /DNA_START=140 /DNA_END=552 /DNA_ORIENTATION=+
MASCATPGLTGLSREDLRRPPSLDRVLRDPRDARDPRELREPTEALSSLQARSAPRLPSSSCTARASVWLASNCIRCRNSPSGDRGTDELSLDVGASTQSAVATKSPLSTMSSAPSSTALLSRPRRLGGGRSLAASSS